MLYSVNAQHKTTPLSNYFQHAKDLQMAIRNSQTDFHQSFCCSQRLLTQSRKQISRVSIKGFPHGERWGGGSCRKVFIDWIASSSSQQSDNVIRYNNEHAALTTLDYYNTLQRDTSVTIRQFNASSMLIAPKWLKLLVSSSVSIVL